MPLITRCPHCSSAFQIDVPILEKAAGQVLCGRCGVQFNAGEHLSFVPSAPAAPQVNTLVGEAPAAEPQAPAAEPVPATEAKPAPEAAAQAAPAEESREDPAPEPQQAEPEQPGEPQPAAAPAVTAAEIAVAQKQRSRASARRNGSVFFALASLVLVGVIGAEVAIWAQATSPDRYPQAALISREVCSRLPGICPDGLTRDPARLEILSRALLKTETPDEYELEVTIRNHSSAPSAMPAMEFTLQDEDGKVMLRRVVTAKESGTPEPIPAGRDRAVRLKMSIAGKAPARHGVELFFP